MSVLQDLSQEQREICAVIFRGVSCLQELSVKRVGAVNKGIDIGIASIESEDLLGLRCYFTIDHDATNVFLAILDGNSDMVLRTLSTINQYFSSGRAPHYGDLIEIDDEISNIDFGIFGAVLLRVRTSPLCKGFPDSFKFTEGRVRNFFLPVFLNASEVGLMKSEGLDSLMDRFSSGRKDIYSFSQETKQDTPSRGERG